MSYHFTPIFDEPTSIRTIVYAHGFSAQWLELYEQSDFRSHDPIPSRTYATGELMTWAEAMSAEPNTPEQQTYLEAMHTEGLEHGFGLALFGPKGRQAYASFDFGVPLGTLEPKTVALTRSLAQMAHQRLCHLIDEEHQYSALSQRESEVLTWMARAKSSYDIGVILGLSPETVKTYRKRIYEKLNAHDRLSVVIRALKLGMIHI